MAIEINISDSPSDVAIVDGVFHHDRAMGYALYEVCRVYFEDNFRGIFLVSEDDEKDIFQNSLETLLNKIEDRKIYVEDGVLKGKNGNPFTSSLTTFFMGIAKLKYKEWVRNHPIGTPFNSENGKKTSQRNDEELYRDILYDEGENSMLSIIADCISKMSERCNQILTLFYYKEKSLDEILGIIPSYKSKNALKTEKNRCMNTLRESANAIYKRLFT